MVLQSDAKWCEVWNSGRFQVGCYQLRMAAILLLIVIEWNYADVWSRHANAWIELDNLPNHVSIIFNASDLHHFWTSHSVQSLIPKNMVQRLPLHDVATMFGHGFHISDFMVFSPPGLRKTSVRNSFLVAFGLMKGGDVHWPQWWRFSHVSLSGAPVLKIGEWWTCWSMSIFPILNEWAKDSNKVRLVRTNQLFLSFLFWVESTLYQKWFLETMEAKNMEG